MSGGKGATRSNAVSTTGEEPASARPAKSELTRERIMRAARRVFAEHPYNEASFRMIAREGGFDHPLINYYFPYKPDLFEAVVAEICEEFYRANIACLEGLERMTTGEGFSLYIDRFLDFNTRNPEPMRIILLNVAHVDRLEEIPGYQHIPEVLARTRGTFEEKIPLRATTEEVVMFLNSFNALAIWFLGAHTCQAQILGMEPSGAEYTAWVKQALLYLFLPRLERLINPQA
ncbi:MAG: TetR/AcrR family transcriptional regulator [Actinobacteria bacterium]|jgi:AcrR family transcriptional regulator|nr:MAG: TetR/AcrR family transcriptional regulator [Actinomycetota bacterium]